MKRQCVKCWLHIPNETNKLRCDRCMEKVMEEVEWKADREFSYYFRFNIKRMKHEENKMSKMLNGDGEKMS